MLNDNSQGRQVSLDRFPDISRGDVLIIMPIDIARTRHLFPRDCRMPELQVIRQAARRFGNDFEAAGDSIDGTRIGNKARASEPQDKALCQINVMQNVS